MVNNNMEVAGGNELSQSTVIRALASLNLQKGNESTSRSVSAQCQESKVEPSINKKRSWNESQLTPVQGRGRQFQQLFASVNKSDNSNNLKETGDFRKSLDINSCNNVSRFEYQSVQSQGRGKRLSKSVSNEPETQSKVRKVLQNATHSTKSVQEEDFKDFSTEVLPAPSKNIICNAVPFASNPIFEYIALFQPDIISETRRSSFLNKHFRKFDKAFLYNGSSVFVPTLLQENELQCSLSNRSIGGLFVMTLEFNGQINLEAHPELLQALLEQAESSERSIFVPKSQMKINPEYVVAIRETKNGTVVCLDCRYYHIQSQDIAELMLELEERYHERFREAVDVLLTKVPIFYAHDNKIYKMLNVEWQNGFLELEKSGHRRTAKPEDCNVAELATDVALYHPQTPKEFLLNTEALFSSQSLKNDWNLRFGSFTKATARVLEPETIIFGDGVQCTPKNGDWGPEMRANEVLTPTELWCWMILYTPTDENCARMFSDNIQSLRDDTGMTIGKPLLYEIETDTKAGYVTALNDVVSSELQLIVVIVPESPNKPEALIKHICCIPKPVPYQIVYSSDVEDPLKCHEITLQLNLILGGVPWTIKLPYQDWMVCGIDLRRAFDNKTLPVCSFVTALTNDAAQWYSKAVFVEDGFVECFKTWLEDTLKKYKCTNGIFPAQLLLYQNCTRETRSQWYEDYAGFNFDECLRQLRIKNMEICVILVQRDSSVSFYKDLRSGVDNVPPGTVVDDTITDPSARDFFLTSHCVSSGSIARPTYYEVVKDTCGLTSEQLQSVTYKMCHLYYKHAKTVEAPAPCLYAEKLGVLVAEDVRGVPSPNLDECLYYL